MRLLIGLYQKNVASLHKRVPKKAPGLFGKYLVITNTVSSGLLMAVADLIQQKIEQKQHKKTEQYDWSRVGRMTTVGLFLGPVNHIGYSILDKLFPTRNTVTILKKLCLDQIVMSSTALIFFFCGMGLLEGRKIKDCLEELRSKFFTVFKTDCCVWLPSQVVNFIFVPATYRVLYINVVQMMYNVFLSYAKHVEADKLYESSLFNFM